MGQRCSSGGLRLNPQAEQLKGAKALWHWQRASSTLGLLSLNVDVQAIGKEVYGALLASILSHRVRHQKP